MSVNWGEIPIVDEAEAVWLGSDGVLKERECFYCGEALEYPYQVWRGFGSLLFLHPRCTVGLTRQLLVDAERAERGLATWRQEQRSQRRTRRAECREMEEEITRVLDEAARAGAERFNEFHVARWLADTDPDGGRDCDDWDRRRAAGVLGQMVRLGCADRWPDGGYVPTGKRPGAAGLREALERQAAQLATTAAREGELKAQLVALEAQFRATAEALAEVQAVGQPPDAVPVRLDPQRSFSRVQKQEIYRRCNGHCVGCGGPLDSDWQADHVVPHSRGGRTEVINGQAMCRPCNSRKRAKVLTVDE